MKRRDFVVGAAGAGTALSLFPAGLQGLERERGPGGLERRALGKTGEKLSIIGFGGIVVTNATTEQAAERVRAAIEAGVNYFDVAPSYGNAEDMLGPALEPHRKGVFLACKTQGRTREAATKELESSLRKMRTDHFDLYQHHAVTKRKDVADDPRPRRRHGGLRGGEEGGQGPLPGLLGALRGGGDRAHGRLRLRHDPLPGQLRHLARRRLRPAGAREGEGEGHGDPLPQGDGEGPVAGGRDEALRQVLVRAARHARDGRDGPALHPVAPGDGRDPARATRRCSPWP